MNNKSKAFLDKVSTFKDVFDNIPLHVVITDEDGVVMYANKEVEKITGFTLKEIIGHNTNLWGGMMENSFYQEFWNEIKTKKKSYEGIIQNKRKNGAKYYAALKVTPILEENGDLLGFCGIEQDITEIQRLSDEHDLNQRQRNILSRANLVSS